ncbi:MAG: hypothetical protein K9K63_05990 [Desulfotignum sp.]|nr:hypothetical protein [Desulfotignum sp.]MCF8090781.1 hypothetical protein [Desulfotignum sp.]MCF8136845.1 hypothetical protein [Desulfotignum sp.]
MADTDRDRMLKLGQWLQGYLSAGVTAKGHRKLAQSFIKLYNVDFKLSRNDVTLRVFELMDKPDLQAEKYKNFFVKHIGNLIDRVKDTIDKNTAEDKKLIVEDVKHTAEDGKHTVEDGKHTAEEGKLIVEEDPVFDDLYHSDPYPEGKEIFEEIKKTVFQYEPTTREGDYYNFDGDYYKWAVHCLSIVSHAIQIKSEAESILHEVLNSSESWKKTFAAKIENDRQHFKILPVYLHHSYNCLTEKLLVKTDNVERLVVFSGDYALSKSCAMTPSVFPWEAAVSRILFDFLLTGGQDYFKFCEYCGAFTVIHRRGSKKFCSDRCRARHRIDEIAKSQ